jgi:hypothetical protein
MREIMKQFLSLARKITIDIPIDDGWRQRLFVKCFGWGSDET